MTKNYTDQLAQWATKRQGRARERNLVVFHALQDDVRAALDAGFSSKTIWAHMQEQGRIDFGYETFLDYVNRVIKTARMAKPGFRSGADVVAGAERADDSQKERLAAKSSTEPPMARPLHAPSPVTPAAPPSPQLQPRRTSMPTFKFNPIPQREDNV
ncbi:TraK family protein [Variovorax sp. RHLX14]|uniref:TraK family protein n=1 Tax=Variovorax sp. RHLX14 TaxID=1259731 RepID=UPI003F44CDE0